MNMRIEKTIIFWCNECSANPEIQGNPNLNILISVLAPVLCHNCLKKIRDLIDNYLKENE